VFNSVTKCVFGVVIFLYPSIKIVQLKFKCIVLMKRDFVFKLEYVGARCVPPSSTYR